MEYKPTQIHEDHNGLKVTEEPMLTPSGAEVLGHRFVAQCPSTSEEVDDYFSELEFQCGPVPAHGVNGWTNEALLAVLIRRTEVLNSQFPCPENVAAIYDMKQALEQFESRTRNRLQRGVEGQHKL